MVSIAENGRHIESELQVSIIRQLHERISNGSITSVCLTGTFIRIGMAMRRVHNAAECRCYQSIDLFRARTGFYILQYIFESII